MITVFILLLMIITVNCQDEECYAKHEDMYEFRSGCLKIVEPSMVRFRRMDSDKNKKISREEFIRFDWCWHRYYEFVFCSIDTDQDKFVSLDEYIVYISDAPDVIEEFNQYAGADKKLDLLEHSKMIFLKPSPNNDNSRFKLLDKNGDNEISLKEFKNLYYVPCVFLRYDKNKNDIFDLDEAKAYLSDLDIDTSMVDYYIEGYGPLTRRNTLKMAYRVPDDFFFTQGTNMWG